MSRDHLIIDFTKFSMSINVLGIYLKWDLCNKNIQKLLMGICDY